MSANSYDHAAHKRWAGNRASVSTSYELLVNANAFLTDLEQEIQRATSDVKLQFHTFEADTVGQRIGQSLLRAVRGGVGVQLLADHYTDLYQSNKLIHLPRLNTAVRQTLLHEWEAMYVLFQSMQAQGIQIRRTNPLGFLFHKALQRDHKKLVIIDGGDKERQVAYVGGFNIADHHAAWHDFMVKMRGPIVTHLSDDFERTWNGDAHSARRIQYEDGFLLTDCPGTSLIFDAALQHINIAARRVILESPYVYGQTIKEALINAAERGVAVSLIVPLHNNHRLFVLTPRSLREMAARGMHVYQYSGHGGMTHAKALLVDDVAVFGSANFNQFLAGKLAELSVVTQNAVLVSQLEAMLKQDIASAVEILSGKPGWGFNPSKALREEDNE